MNDALEQTHVHQSLLRAQTFLGGDRRLGVFAAMITSLIVASGFFAMDWRIMTGGAVFGVIVFGALGKMHKADPLLFDVYRTSTGLQHIYPARSTPFAGR